MRFLFLLTASSTPCISPARLAAVLADVKDSGVMVGRIEWLMQGVACRIPVDGIVNIDAVREAVKGDPIDVVVLPAALATPKKLLLADMDSTIIKTESLDELAAYAGVQEKVAAITARAMNGELDFEAALKERVAMLKGLSETIITEVLAETPFMAGAATLIATMKAKGARCVLVSGGFKQFTGYVRSTLGFDDDHANTLEIRDGILTGQVIPPIVDKNTKLAVLKAELSSLGLDAADSITVGDGANDIPMLQAAGLGVAFHAKPATAAAAPIHLAHSDLTGLLFLQGYGARDFVHHLK